MITCIQKPPAQDTQALQEVWAQVDYNSCPYQYNFHMHTNCSDGQLNPIRLIEQVVAIGLKGLAITDHHTVQGFFQAQQLLEQTHSQHPSLPLPHLWTGLEITSVLLEVEVHLLCYGFNPQHPSVTPYLTGKSPTESHSQAHQVIHTVHEAEGLVVLAHPFRYQKKAQELIKAAAALGVDGVESYYSYNNPKPWIPSPVQTQESIELAHQYGLWNTCGTDSHGLNLLQRI